MTEYLVLLRHAADQERPLLERRRLLDILDRTTDFMDGDAIQAYSKIREDILSRIRLQTSQALNGHS